jgi:glycosyltransferase involved in cell wall biosynthesis
MRTRSPSTLRDLHIGCFSDVHGWGGALSFAAGVVNASRERGLSTLLLGATARGDEPPVAQRDVARLNMRLRRRPLVWRVQSWQVGGQLSRQLRRLAPPRRGFIALSPYWVVAAKRAWWRVPVVYKLPCLLHNCLPFTWPERRPPTMWKSVDFAGITRQEHLAFALADLIVTPTEAARREVLDFHPAAQGRVAVCTYGPGPRAVDPELRGRQRGLLGLDPDMVVFLAAGVCDLNKAFDWAIRELASTDERAHLVIVGDGSERPRLLQLAVDATVAKRVHLAGMQRDMEPWYAAADCVISTSFYDTYPNTLQEALCRGRPVITPLHRPPEVYAGFAEVITAGGGGLLYDRLQAGALAECMNRVARAADLRAELGRQARSISERWLRHTAILDHVPVVGGPEYTGHAPAGEATP